MNMKLLSSSFVKTVAVLPAALLFFAAIPSQAQIVSYDFSTSGQFTDNFTLFNNTPSPAITGTVTNNAWNAGEFVRSTRNTTTGGGWSTVMRLNDDTATLGLAPTNPSYTVQMDFRINQTAPANLSDQTIGFYFGADGTDAALFQFTARSGNSNNVRFRSYHSADLTTAGAVGTNIITDETQNTGGGGQPGNFANNTWYTLRLDVAVINGNQIGATLGWYQQGGVTLLHEEESVFSVANSANYLDGGHIAIRSIHNGGEGQRTSAIDIDNFAIIPEPSTYALLGLGLGALLWLRRRNGQA